MLAGVVTGQGRGRVRVGHVVVMASCGSTPLLRAAALALEAVRVSLISVRRLNVSCTVGASSARGVGAPAGPPAW